MNMGCGIIIIGLLIAIALFVGALAALDSVVCHWSWDGSGRQVRYQVLSGCQVHDGKGWVSAENFRAL